MINKKKFLEQIQLNIAKYGYHITIVNSHTEPRYVYTIGLYKKFGFELIFAGGIYYLKDDLDLIFRKIINEIAKNNGKVPLKEINSPLGIFSLENVDHSWSDQLMLGVLDFYGIDNTKAYQIKPETKYYTLDIPDMSQNWNLSPTPVWSWLNKKWDYPVPENSCVITNLAALKGEKITEVMRWEKDEWEMFVGSSPDIEKKDCRVVPLATIIGIDETLQEAVKLEIGKGMWRDEVELQWHPWG